MALQIGRRGKVFLKKEAAYGVNPGLAATNFMRHINVGLGFDPFNRVTSAERKVSPGAVNRFDRRRSASLGTLVGLLRPSGTLNTLGECDPVLEAALGAKTNVTLSTTVASGGTTTGATLASGAGLAKGDAVLITRNSVRYVRFLTSVAGAVVTWAPALPTAVVNAEVVKGCITYKLTTDLALSLVIAHYLPGFTRELLGAGIDSLSLEFDGTEEARFTASGPASVQNTPAPAEPGSATQVGGNPPTGMVGELYIGDLAYLHTSLSFELTNGLALRHSEAGTSAPSEIYRASRREITAALSSFAGENEATLYDFTEAGTNKGVFRQNGRTEGNIVAVQAPQVEWKVAETGDEEEAVMWNFTGTCLESADGENDELRIAFA